MVKHSITEFLNPARNDAGFASVVRIRLINKQGWVSSLPEYLGIPIVVVNRFIVPIPQSNELLGTLIDIHRPDGEVVDDRHKPHSDFIQRTTKHSRRTIMRQKVGCHATNHGIEVSFFSHPFLLPPVRTSPPEQAATQSPN